MLRSAPVPELPDVAIYVEALTAKLKGRTLERVRIAAPFLLRSVGVSPREAEDKSVAGFRRLGKRIAMELDAGPFLLFHLMIAGRFHWKEAGAAVPKRSRKPAAPSPLESRDLAGVPVAIPKKVGLAAFDFPNGTLLLTEASPKKRASLHIVRTAAELSEHDRGGLEVLESDLASFASALTLENHTLKRALTDPTLFSGIGNAYSDEILHAARLSPVKLTSRLSEEEIARLHQATRDTLTMWTERLRQELAKYPNGFPEKVTAFREDMAVHGRFGQPCPVCGTKVQRIVHAENEANYCPTCQTDGKLLADRALSRLLRGDWPKTLEELEERKARRRTEA